MNLREMQYVVAVADLRSFTQAAEQCFVSQPTLSGQIKKLEDQLGVAIFERTNKRVMPTDVGESIISAARRVLREMENIRESASAAHDPLAGRFRLGAFPTLSSYLLPKLVPKIVEDMPNLRLILMEEKTDDLLDKLRRGTIDAAFLALPVRDDFLVSRQLFEDPFVLAVSDRHELANMDVVDQGLLVRHQLLLLEEGHCLRDQSLAVCRLLGVGEDPDFRATSLETLRQMVKAGTGITLMPKIAVGDDAGIRYLPFTANPPSRTIGLVWRKTSAREKVAHRLCQVVEALLL